MINGTVQVTGPVAPSDVNDTYPTHSSKYGKGGVHEASTTTDRNNIPLDRREWGMLCNVYNHTGYNGIYVLKPVNSSDLSDNTNWILLSQQGNFFQLPVPKIKLAGEGKHDEYYGRILDKYEPNVTYTETELKLDGKYAFRFHTDIEDNIDKIGLFLRSEFNLDNSAMSITVTIQEIDYNDEPSSVIVFAETFSPDRIRDEFLNLTSYNRPVILSLASLFSPEAINDYYVVLTLFNTDRTIFAKSTGLPFQYSGDNGATWTSYNSSSISPVYTFLNENYQYLLNVREYRGEHEGSLHSRKAALINPPFVIAQDFTQDFLDNNQVFVEMLYYRRKIRKTSGSNPTVFDSNHAGFVVKGTSNPIFQNFWSRNNLGGYQTIINHYPVNNVNEKIPVWEYLDYMFSHYGIVARFRDSYGVIGFEGFMSTPPTYNSLNTFIPSLFMSTGAAVHGWYPTKKFAYSSMYRATYVKFRYIIFEPTANNNRGQIISGPLSPTIKISHEYFPFKYDREDSNLENKSVCKINTRYDKYKLKCNIEKDN